MLRSQWIPSKSEVYSKKEIVTAMHPLAAEAGVHILNSGGNAIDAAVAIGFAICVVEPFMSSIGGVGYMLFQNSRDGKIYSIDYGPKAPMDAWDTMYQLDNKEISPYIGLGGVRGQENVRGHRSVGVPGVIAGLCHALEKFGSLSLEQVIEPALHYASHGFPVNWHTTLMIGSCMDLINRNVAAQAAFLPNKRPPSHWPTAEIFKQRDLASVLELISKKGSAVFYKGEIADAIVNEFVKNNGLLTDEDFSNYEVICSKPSTVNYRSFKVHGVPQANGSHTVMQALKVLSNFNLAKFKHNSLDYLHVLIEVLRHIFADRYSFLGDPSYSSVPLDGMLSSDYSKEISRMVNQEKTLFKARNVVEPWIAYSDQHLHDPWHFEKSNSVNRYPEYYPGNSHDSDCTTHFNVIDKDRNVVSCTQTAVSMFGSGIVVPGTGILMNNSMLWFNPRPGYANSIAGYKRPLVNMSPVVVTHGNRPYLALGAPGGRKIICAVLQILINVMDFGYGIQQAIEKPRIDASGIETLIDFRCDEQIVNSLRELGHEINRVQESPGDAAFARPSGILVSGEGNFLTAGVDPFRVAEAIGS